MPRTNCLTRKDARNASTLRATHDVTPGVIDSSQKTSLAALDQYAPPALLAVSGNNAPGTRELGQHVLLLLYEDSGKNCVSLVLERAVNQRQHLREN